MMYGGYFPELIKEGFLQPGKNDDLVPVTNLHLQGVCSGPHPDQVQRPQRLLEETG
jgi:hypothetical protein